MTEHVIFIIVSIIWVIALSAISSTRSGKIIFVFKYILMIITVYQYYSIFIYGGTTKGGYQAEEILLFENLLVRTFQFPSYIQPFSFFIFIFVCFFVIPNKKIVRNSPILFSCVTM